MFEHDFGDTDPEARPPVRLLPKGEWFTFEIKSYEEKTTKNGNPMMALECEVVSQDEWEGTTVYHNVNFFHKEHKGAWISVHFVHSLGLPCNGMRNVDGEDWLGRRFKGEVDHREYNGKTYNSIKNVMPLEDTAAVKEDDPFAGVEP